MTTNLPPEALRAPEGARSELSGTPTMWLELVIALAVVVAILAAPMLAFWLTTLGSCA